jgi:hypothetical protein
LWELTERQDRKTYGLERLVRLMLTRKEYIKRELFSSVTIKALRMNIYIHIT